MKHYLKEVGNAVDAACAMLGVVCTMYDVLSWAGDTQALIYDPVQKRVFGINALGVALTGATPECFHERGMAYPPDEGPLAAVTPGTPGGLLTMLAEFGTMSLAQVLQPAMEMAGGYPIEASLANQWEAEKETLKRTLEKLVEAERQALEGGATRKEAIFAAYDRFYRGDIAQEFVRGSREQGGLHTREDLDHWKVYIEEPVSTTYKGIEVYKLNSWVQGSVMIQMLNMLDHFDLQALDYNSAEYIRTIYQVMNLAYAVRDFYYGNPGCRGERMGGLGHPQRRLDPRLRRRTHRLRNEPAHAELRAGLWEEPLQRGRAGQATPGHAYPGHGTQRWQALPLLLGAGRGPAGPVAAPVVPRHG